MPLCRPMNVTLMVRPTASQPKIHQCLVSLGPPPATPPGEAGAAVHPLCLVFHRSVVGFIKSKVPRPKKETADGFVCQWSQPGVSRST